MNDTLLVILFTLIGFLAVILSLAAGKSTNNKIIGICSGFAIVVGILSYSYGYSCHEGFSITVVIKTLFKVCRMFSGNSDFDVVAGTPLFKNGVVVMLFWIGHFMAFYITASTAVKFLGKRVLKSLRTRMTRRGALSLVYGATPESVCLVGEKSKGRHFLLVSECSDETAGVLAESLSGVEFPGGIALCTDKKFLKSIGMRGGRRNMDVYCVGDDPSKNLRYAQALLPALQERDVSPDAISLFLLGVPEDRASRLLALNGRYGYGALFACGQHELIARLIVDKCPPWRFIHCDAQGRAKNDFRAFIVGFGQMGQAVLRQLIINGQMEGSAFHAEVFDRRMNEEKGFFDALYPALLRNYDVILHEAAANSDLFYERLIMNPPSVVVLCSGDHKRNMELGQILYRKYGTRPDRPCLIQCTPDSVLIDEVEYRLGNVNVREMDRVGMALYHVHRGGPSAEEDWKDCDPFSRAACRASFSFLDALLYAAGVSREEVLAGKWPPSSGVLENLARTEHEHRRAFYMAMGYGPMDETELRRRCELYRRGEIGNIEDNNIEATHACLVPWEELDALSRRVTEAAGKEVDYQADNRNGVLAIPEILRMIG